jgi:hypothetical protein
MYLQLYLHLFSQFPTPTPVKAENTPLCTPKQCYSRKKNQKKLGQEFQINLKYFKANLWIINDVSVHK